MHNLRDRVARFEGEPSRRVHGDVHKMLFFESQQPSGSLKRPLLRIHYFAAGVDAAGVPNMLDKKLGGVGSPALARDSSALARSSEASLFSFSMVGTEPAKRLTKKTMHRSVMIAITQLRNTSIHEEVN